MGKRTAGEDLQYVNSDQTQDDEDDDEVSIIFLPVLLSVTRF